MSDTGWLRRLASKEPKPRTTKPRTAAAAATTDRTERTSLQDFLVIRQSLRDGRRAFAEVLTEPCAAHDAPAGVPCWYVIERPALCGARITRRWTKED